MRARLCVCWVIVNDYVDIYGSCVSLHYLHSAPTNLTQTNSLKRSFIHALVFSLVPISAGH